MASYNGADKRLEFLFDMVSNFAQDYSDAGTYAVGAYAIYQGILYKCTTAVSVAEAFDPTKWAHVLVMGEISTGGGGGSVVTITPTLSAGTKIADYTINGVGGALYAPSGGGGINFSETEHVIGTWIDGSTLYEKTIDFGALPANTQKNVNHGISNFDLIVEIIATATRPASQGTHTSIAIPSTHWESISNQNEISVNDTTIMIRNHNSSFSAWTKTYVTLRYTKASS